jgi:hypothetical protein
MAMREKAAAVATLEPLAEANSALEATEAEASPPGTLLRKTRAAAKRPLVSPAPEAT